ncbi:hypothetical protein BU16DRAFT_591977 [Lophium mytilinum]|uniref:Uncharacterized protein n=1 Tax=Lophium mytilinum TaxID=390894 RepID=A0A6A6QMC0_9PEZI|nr:hypothetical protein BU16DRAFT_591977 [Lophium mytilinum]
MGLLQTDAGIKDPRNTTEVTASKLPRSKAAWTPEREKAVPTQNRFPQANHEPSYRLVPRPWQETRSSVDYPKGPEGPDPMQRWQQESVRDQVWNNVASVVVAENVDVRGNSQEDIYLGTLDDLMLDVDASSSFVEGQDGQEKQA